MLYRWCCCVVSVTPGLAAAAVGQVAFRAPGVLPAPPLWALCSFCFFPWCQGVVSCFLFGCTQGCSVLCVGFRRSSARWVLLAVASCLGPCSCAPLVVLLVRSRGPALRLGVCLLGFSCCCLRCYTCTYSHYCVSLYHKMYNECSMISSRMALHNAHSVICAVKIDKGANLSCQEQV